MAFTPTFTGVTTSPYYEMGFTISVTNDDSAHEYSTVVIQPYLRKIVSSVSRAQHIWNIHFAVDGVYENTKYYHGTNEQGVADNNYYLPNSAAGNVSTGKLYMEVNVWYPWGYPYTTTLKNDGWEHSIGVYMHCESTIPRYCPAYNTYLWGHYVTSKYGVTPAAPSGLKADFNESTRKVTYSWDPADCQYIILYRKLYDTTNRLVQAGNIGIAGRDNDKLYNTDIGKLSETLSEDIAYVKYQMINYSSTGHSTKSAEHILTLDLDSKVWVYVNGGWKKAIPWVNTPDGWKKATKTYVRVGNDWKRTTT